MLDELGRQRNITARCAHFGLIPDMVASSLLVLTTGRQYCERFASRLPLKILECPVALPRLMYYQLWHERTHSSSSARWLRECIKEVAASLRPPVRPYPADPAPPARQRARPPHLKPRIPERTPFAPAS